ncbi:MAG: phosphoribosylformylglycinamidine cyclo-ligase, partial [Solirubrobacteraceae bacterium]|nr:phosphoribosylformylglycinamidine cyclo-ligase [Solirubrobacteraceae bacterium]
SGLHSNGYTLARRILEPLGDDATPPELGGATVADVLLEPTVIYVRAVLALLRSDVEVHGLAHITGGGLSNLQRLNDGVGYQLDEPLPVLAVFDLIQQLGAVDDDEMHEVFNMGCGFIAVVPTEQAADAAALLASHHPGAAAIGLVTGEAGAISRRG